MLAALILLLGGGAYALAEGTFGLTFNATPLFLGAVVVAAGLLGRRRPLLPNGLVLLAWGSAVLLLRDGFVPTDREPPFYIGAFGVGVLAARLLSRPDERSSWFTAAAVTTVVSAASYYSAYETSTTGHWPFFALSLVAWAAFEGGRTLVLQRRPVAQPA